MEFRGVGIIIWKGMAYLPSFAVYNSGIVVQTAPVYVVHLDADELQAAIEKILSAECPMLPDPTSDEWESRIDPILDATKAKNWNELAKNGAAYGLEWMEQGIRLDISRLDKKGRWEINPDNAKIFPADASLKDVLKVILQDIETRLVIPD